MSDRGGNRQLNNAIHTIALTRIRHDPPTAIYVARQREAGKTQREAIRCLKTAPRPPDLPASRRPNSIPQTICLT